MELNIKKLYLTISMILSFSVFAEPTYIWDQPKSYGEGMNRQLMERQGDIRVYNTPKSYGEGMNNQLTERNEDIRVYSQPKNYGEGVRNQLTEPANSYRTGR